MSLTKNFVVYYAELEGGQRILMHVGDYCIGEKVSTQWGEKKVVKIVKEVLDLREDTPPNC